MPTITLDEMTLAAGQLTPPGWYDDPGRRHDYRYWDGERWTDGPNYYLLRLSAGDNKPCNQNIIAGLNFQAG